MNPCSDYPPTNYMDSSSNNGASSSNFYLNVDFSRNEDQTKMSHMIRWNSGKRVDPRLLGMLEAFGEIYVERHELFDKIFHGDHEEVFKKIGHALKKKRSMKKSGSMTRSMSMRATRQRGILQEENGANEFRAQRFKIRTPNVIEVEVEEQGDNQPTKGSSN